MYKRFQLKKTFEKKSMHVNENISRDKEFFCQESYAYSANKQLLMHQSLLSLYFSDLPPECFDNRISSHFEF